jgi:large subunit ribosomal protein L25
VHFLNEEESPGIKFGGVLNVVRHAIEVLCTADQIPDGFDVDLSGLEVGDSVHASALALPQGVELTITDRDFTIATIAAPTVMPATEDVEESTEAAPEDAGDADKDKEESGD